MRGKGERRREENLLAMVPKTCRKEARKPDARPMSPGSQTSPAMMMVMSLDDWKIRTAALDRLGASGHVF